MINVEHSILTARIPEEIGNGSFANEMVILRGPGELAIDFIQSIGAPRRLVARVIMNTTTVGQLIKVLEEKTENCTLTMNGCTFVLGGGGVRWISPGENEKQDENTVNEIYEITKVEDGTLMGRYANMVTASHSNGDFCLDFVLSLFPRSVVTSRIFMSMSHVTELLAALKSTKW